MPFSTIIELGGLVVVVLTHFVIVVAKFQKHENAIQSLETRVTELHKSNLKHIENNKTLHNIEGKLEIILSLFQKQCK